MVVVSSFAPPTDGIKHQQSNTTVFINDREVGKGTLFITESRLSWVNSNTGQGFSLEYPHIALHAVSRDLTAYPNECLYLMVDTKLEDAEICEDEFEESESDMTELRLVPDDKGMLDAMFHAMSACQALHPDPQDSLSENEDDFFEDAEDEGEYDVNIGGDGDAPRIINDGPLENSNGFQRREEPMDMEEGQFEDAEFEPDN